MQQANKTLALVTSFGGPPDQMADRASEAGVMSEAGESCSLQRSTGGRFPNLPLTPAGKPAWKRAESIRMWARDVSVMLRVNSWS